MSFKEQLKKLTDKTKNRPLSPEESKKIQEGYAKAMAKAITGTSNLLVDMLCRYGDRKEAVVGINITPHYIRLCQMQQRFDRWSVTHLDSVCIEEKFTTEDMLGSIDQYVDHLVELVKKNGIKTKNVSLSVPLSSSIVQVVNAPQMGDEELAQAATMESFWQSMVHTNENLYEFSISYRIIKRKDDGTMDMLFVASKLDDINLYTEIVKRAGLNPVIVDVRCFALKNALALSAESVSDAYPSAFLELGPDENHILILDDNEIYTYPVSFSNVSVSEVIVDNFKNSEMLELFVNEYANQVREVIHQHQEQHQGDSVKHIYVVSFLPITGTFLSKLSTLLQEYFVSEYNILDHVDVPLRLTSRVQGQENLSAWAVTMGTAIRQLNIFGYLKKGKPEQTNNLLPGSDTFIRQERFKLVSKMCLVAVASLVLFISSSVSIGLFMTSRSLYWQLFELSNVESEHQTITTQLQKLSKNSKRLRSLDEIKATLPSNQKPLLVAYKRLNTVIPEGVWLKEMTFSEPQSIEITGSAIGDQQILDFIGLLNEGGEFEKVSLKTMKTTSDKDLYAKRSVQIKTFVLHGVVNKEMPAEEEIQEIKESANVSS